jgi:hypothetical protein
MDIKISIFDFLRIEHLTHVGDFSPSVDSGATVDHYNVLKLYFCVIKLIVESNELSKCGLGIEIGQLCAEIQLLSHRKTGKIATFRRNRKFSKSYIFTFFT